MRTRRAIGVALTLLVLAAAIGAGAYLATGKLFGVSLDLSLRSSRVRAQSVAVFQGSRNILSLSTVEVVYKTVFPHDYIPADMDWRRLIEQREAGRRMSVQELEYLEVYDLCLEIGIDLRRDDTSFVVVTAAVHGGFDLMGTVFAKEDPDEDALRAAIGISEDRIVTVTLPPVAVTDLVIEDERSGDYGYPDIHVGPDQWRRITALVDDKVRQRIMQEGKLEAARRNGEAFIRGLVRDLGYRDVIFRE